MLYCHKQHLQSTRNEWDKKKQNTFLYFSENSMDMLGGICLILLRIIEHPELEGTHKDH